MNIDYLADRPELIPTLANWLNTEWGHLPPWSNVASIERTFEVRLSKDTAPLTLVAIDEEIPVGTASIKRYEMGGAPDFEHWIGDVLVLPSQRGKGIGSALTKKIVDVATEIGISKLYLYTPDQESMYARLGWKVVDRRAYNGEDVVVMVKELGATGS